MFVPSTRISSRHLLAPKPLRTPFQVYMSCMPVLLALACVDKHPADDEPTSRDDHEADAAAQEVMLPGKELSFEVGSTQRTLIDLDDLEVQHPDASEQSDWDLAFIGWGCSPTAARVAPVTALRSGR